MYGKNEEVLHMYIKGIMPGGISSNCYVLCDEASGEGALCDVGEYNALVENEIKAAGIKTLKYILCTHGHFDHVYGIRDTKERFPEAKTVIGLLDAELLHDSYKNLADAFGIVYDKNTEADITVTRGDVLTLGETKLRVIETPGHSQGGVCYVCDSEKFLLSGDTIFKLTIGRTDKWGSDFDTLIESIKKLMTLPDDYKIYTGHNIPTTVGDERTGNRFSKYFNK